MIICGRRLLEGNGLSQHHNYILMELSLPTTLTRHFALRLRQYLLFLEVTNDSELIQLLLSFLPLKDVLRLLAVSSHFASFRQVQSVELRILRAKLAHYEKPEQTVGWSSFLQFVPIKLQAGQKKTHKMEMEYKNLIKFRQGMKFFKDLKRKGLADSKESLQKIMAKKGYAEFSKFYEEFHKEEKRLEEKLKQQPQVWAKVSQDEYISKHFRQQQSKSQLRTLPEPTKKPLIKPNTSQLDLLQHHHARMDYQRRKARKIQEKQEFIPIEQFKQLAEQDPCIRQVYNRVYEDEKTRQQQENVAKLRMGTAPDPQKLPFEATEMKIMRQSIASKMFSGIKSLLGQS